MRRARTFVLLALALTLVAPAVGAEVLDTTYGEGGRTRATFDDIDPVGTTFGTIDSAGRAVQIAIGTTTPDRVIRFNPNGQLDRTFGDDGEAPLPDGIAFWVEAVPGHGVVVGGFAREGYEYVLRLTEDGQRDVRFGVDGMLFDPDLSQDFNPVAFGPAGQLLVLRRADGPTFLRQYELYGPDGELDETFGTGGVLEAFGIADSGNSRVAASFDGSGRLVYISSPCPTCAAIRRLTTTGQPDASFGQAGAFDLVSPDPATYWALDVDQAGVVVAGQTGSGTTRVWRATLAGQPDPALPSPALSSLEGGRLTVAALAQGRTVVTAGEFSGQSVLVLAANGSKDPGWTTNPRTYHGDWLTGAGDGGVPGQLLLGRTTTHGVSFVSRYSLDPGGLPAPEITAVVARPDAVSVMWDASGELAAEAVAYHVILMSGTRIGGHVLVAGDAREASINGIDSDDYFEVVVVPYTRAGAGPRSEPQDAWTNASGAEAGAPSSVGQISVHGVDRGLQVSWAPANSNGAPVLAYSVIAVDPATGQVAAWRNVGADVRSAALGGLSAVRANYLVHVVAWNEHGIGGPNFAGGATAPGQAGAPPSVPWVSAARAPGATYVTWGAPVEHGQPIVGFDVVVVEDGKMLSWAQPGPDQRQLVLPALQDGSDAQVYVFGHSASGFGPIGSPVEP